MNALAAVRDNGSMVIREILDNVSYRIEVKNNGTLNLVSSHLAQKEEFLAVAAKYIKANKKLFARYENKNISAERFSSITRNTIFFRETIKKGMLAAHVNLQEIPAKEPAVMLEFPVSFAFAYARM